MGQFVVFGLPRSRTTWLSKFLSYGDWTCTHDELRHARTLDDIKTWMTLDYTGSAETGAAPWWRLLPRDMRCVVVRRDPAAVLDSFLRVPMRGVCVFDRQQLQTRIAYLDRKLDQVAARMPKCVSVSFDDLAHEAACAHVFEHCLTVQHDTVWWRAHDAINIQCDLPSEMRYCIAFGPALERLAATAKLRTLAAFARRPIADRPDLVIQQEPFGAFLRDGAPAFNAHSASVGEAESSYLEKNLPLMQALEGRGALIVTTARSNGRLFGYLMSVISPSLDSRTVTSAVHTLFYASPDFPGLGAKLQRAALPALKARGVSELFMRAGITSVGARIGTLYRRLGAESVGSIYRLDLEGV